MFDSLDADRPPLTHTRAGAYTHTHAHTSHLHSKVRKTAFGSVDAVPHRHFEDPAEAIRSLKARNAFVCALETTEGASSLFDVRFPRPPPLDDLQALAKGAGFDSGSAGGPSDDGDAAMPPPSAERDVVARDAGAKLAGGSSVAKVEMGEQGGVLEEGGVVALVLGNEVTGVDERVLELCDMVIEVGALRLGGGRVKVVHGSLMIWVGGQEEGKGLLNSSPIKLLSSYEVFTAIVCCQRGWM